jgi:AmmeMemoRadiSam system protein A
MSESLADDSRRYLLELVRRSISTKLKDGDFPRTPPKDPALLEPRGAFVTLKNSGMLRGCIGRMESERPLWETVAMMARAAAFEDPRFQPVTLEELGGLSVEISILTPFERLEKPETVVVGKHGLLIEKGFNRGVLLPQVAVDHGWSAEEFLANVCHKASLPSDAWRDPEAKLHVFSALIIEE